MIFSNTSASPCDQQPGNPGTQTAKPSSDSSSRILYFIVDLLNDTVIITLNPRRLGQAGPRTGGVPYEHNMAEEDFEGAFVVNGLHNGRTVSYVYFVSHCSAASTLSKPTVSEPASLAK